MRGLKGKSAIVTGGSGGIGYACCQRLLEEGARVCVLDIREDILNVAVEQLSVVSPDVFGLVCDVTDYQSVEATVKEAHDRLGSIDILFNIAGITADALTAKMTIEQWNRVINVNLNGSFFVGKAVLAYMFEQKSGSIVNTASTAGIYGNAGQANYSATKGAVIALAKAWAKEFGKYNIRSNAIAPGLVNTNMIKTIPAHLMEKKIAAVSMRRVCEPSEIAAAFCFLASDDASYVNGQVLEVSGGR